MKTSFHSHDSKHHRDPRGFALVVTLSLMILLTVIAVGLLSLSSITLRASSQGQAMQTARANARMALMLALGDLQKSLGPDARMSARAETLAKDPRVGATVAANTPKAWWLGASHSDGKTPLGKGANDAVTWLISGLPNGSFSSSLTDPVDMIKGGSLDLGLFTGGAPIQAGRVPVTNSAGKITGTYAYFVDDDGMKAQLAASHADVRNDSPDNLAGGVLPGTYPLTQLQDLSGAAGTGDVALVQKLGSTRDLQLIGVSKGIATKKYFAYTTRSKGVLSDSRSGGLKKDLTIAFETPAVFDKVFPKATPDKFIAITPEKLTEASDLKTNGYINWAIFRDYYNLKKSIKVLSGVPYLEMSLMANAGFSNPDPNNSPFFTGVLGPHQMRGTGNHLGMPHGGTYSTNANPVKNREFLKYQSNPIFPLMLELWQKSWLSTEPKPGTTMEPNQIQANCQVFTSHYNPYNIGIYTLGDDNKRGARVIKYPQVILDVQDGAGTVFVKKEGDPPNTTTTPMIRRELTTIGEKLTSHIDAPKILEPGHAHMFGFAQDKSKNSTQDAKMYTDKVADSLFKSAYDTRFTRINVADTGPQFDVITEHIMLQPAFSHGVDMSTSDLGYDPEISQVFFAFLAWEAVDGLEGSLKYPGKKFKKGRFGTDGMDLLNANAMQISLRTTNETASRLRPLVDANIRAQWNNPRWDSKLGLRGLAGYSYKFSDEENEENQPPNFPETKFGSEQRGFSFWGGGRSPQEGHDRVILFDVPRRDLLSLGQLQHAAAGRFSYEPTYIVGNSYANPRIALTDWKSSSSDTFSTPDRGLDQWKISGPFNLYDASYLVNEMLWDSFTFTTIPQMADNYGGQDVTANDIPALLERKKHLPNPRFIPYEPEGSKFVATNLQAGGTATTGSFFHNAGHLLVDGSFNVNSTSVDAWEAFLTGTLDLPVRKVTENGVIDGFKNTTGVRYPRSATPMGTGMKTASLNENYWTGFRELTDAEVKQLAQEIVKEIKDRGPFLTLGAFVNRKLEDGKNGKSGALQAALDNTVNKGLNTSFQSDADNSVVPTLPDNGNQGAGFPGQLLQGDVLQALGPYMTVRSDTFTIRAYGEAKTGSTVTAKAYCEAVVQRLPDPVKSGGATGTPQAELVLPTSPFGRQFSIVSFRWLHEAEI